MQISKSLDQIKSLLAESQKVLLTAQADSSLDAAVSLLVIREILEKQGKQTTVLLPRFAAEDLPLLFGAEKIETNLPAKSLIVSIDLGGNPLEKISYQTKDGRLNLMVTPKDGKISADMIEFRESRLDYNLVVVVDTPKLELLGDLWQNHKETLNEIPLLNIDHSPDNLFFGKLNLVESSACSIVQIVFEMSEALLWSFSARAATLLYVGLVDKTKGFTQNLSAEVFKMAGRLLELGAKPEVLQSSETAIR